MSTVHYSILTLDVYNMFYSICLQTNFSLQTLIYQYTLFRKSQKLIIECLELTFLIPLMVLRLYAANHRKNLIFEINIELNMEKIELDTHADHTFNRKR